MPAYNYYHHERMRVCLHAYATLDDGSLCSTDLPRCGTSKWNHDNACRYKANAGLLCMRFHGSAKFTSYYITVDHRPRIIYLFRTSFPGGTTEPHSIFLILTASIVFHDWWNQVEPAGTIERAHRKGALPYSLMLYVFVLHQQRHHAVVLKCVAVSPERPRPDDKLATNPITQGGNYGIRCICWFPATTTREC